MGNKENILIQKLDEFIRRYYKNQLIKGTIYSVGILLSAFLTVIFLEYFGEFSSPVRAVLLFSFLGASAFVVSKYIVVPTLKLNRIGSVISYDQAAAIIGNHFSNVQDKLLNVLQLQNARMLSGSDELLLAGINQKINELRPVPFNSAVDLNENKRHLRFLLPLFFFTTGIIIIWPHVISRSTTRLVNYQTYYEKAMPFNFKIQNGSLQALQTEDYRLEVKVTGDQIPNEVYIHVNGIEYKMEKDGNLLFHHTFANLQSSLNFQLGAAGFLTREYELKVLPKPSLLQFNLQLVYPSYLNKPNETISNTGDLQIPQGTKVSWLFNTRNTEELQLKFSDSLVAPERRGEDQFSFAKTFLASDHYQVKAINSFVRNSPDSVSYNVHVVPDQFPSIDVSPKPDSINPKNIYFSGQIKDDYGFTRLTFHFTKKGTDSLGKWYEEQGTIPVALAKSQVTQPYFYFLNAADYALNPGDELSYYFEVFDNDGVKGPKSSRTQLLTFKAPTRDEIMESTQKNNTEIKKDLEESIKKAKQLQKDVNDISKKINDKKQLGYEEKKKLEELLKKQKELENKVNDIKQQNEQNNKQQNEFSQMDESLLEKQKQLEQLFDNVMTPEMKKLFDELNKMLEKLDKNQVQEKLEEMKLNNKDIEKELDRNLELFKQLEVQQKMQFAIEKLDELKQKQENLSEETEGKKPEEKKDEKAGDKSDKKEDADKNKKEENADKKADSTDSKNKDDKKAEDDASKKEDASKDDKKKDDNAKDAKKPDAKELEKKQEEIAKQFEDLKKDLKELQEKNKELEEPNKIPNTEKKQDEISKDMQKSSEQLNQNKKKDASKSQKDAADKMEEMKEEMEQAMMEEEEKQNEENAQDLRQILENLVNLSFSQEELIKKLPNTRVDDPQYVTIPKQQSKLKEDSKIIEDSLLSLSKRAPEISAIINREISAIGMNMDKTVKSLAERNTGESTMRMQSTMTSVNNLALLLNESLEQMQKQMKAQKQAKGSKGGKCKKPGSGTGQKPSDKGSSAASMRKLQEQLNKQLQEMKEALEKGQKPGNKPGDKKGEKPGQGMGQNGSDPGMVPGSEQFAKMAAQQEALRRQMQALMDKLKNKGQNPGGDIANLMEETEKDLVNKRLSNATMKRQQEILSRLLESEKAEREREQDEQRKSNEAKNEKTSNPEEFLEYKRIKEKEMELLNTVPPSLTPYYKEKVNRYFNNLSKE